MEMSKQNEMNNEVHLYRAYYSMEEYPYTFNVQELPIDKMLGDVIVTKDYYLISKDFTTCYFGGFYGERLDTALQLGNGVAYYSTDKAKCMNWLIDIYDAKETEIVAMYNAIRGASIVDCGVLESE